MHLGLKTGSLCPIFCTKFEEICFFSKGLDDSYISFSDILMFQKEEPQICISEWSQDLTLTQNVDWGFLLSTTFPQILTFILLMWRIGWAPNSIPIYSYIQQNAKSHSFFISGNCSACFEWYFHPLSGAHTTVSTASLPLLLSASIVEELELVWVCCGWRTLQGRPGQVRKNSPPPGFDPRTVQSVASRYTDWTTQPTITQPVLVICYWHFGTNFRSHLQGSGIQKGPLKSGPIGLPETSIKKNYHYPLRDNPDKRSSLLVDIYLDNIKNMWLINL
jgi:hypothetical protein